MEHRIAGRGIDGVLGRAERIIRAYGRARGRRARDRFCVNWTRRGERGRADRWWKERRWREKEKESVIQKRRSLHSGHVWRRHTLYGAITYALLSGRGVGGRGIASFYASVRRATEPGGKKSGEGNRCRVRVTGWNGVAIWFFSLSKKWTRTTLEETVMKRDVVEIISSSSLPKFQFYINVVSKEKSFCFTYKINPA